MDDLSTIGITGGLRASLVECVERYQLEELAVWRVLILFSNEYALTILFEGGLNHDDVFEDWLVEEAGDHVVVASSSPSAGWLEEMPF